MKVMKKIIFTILAVATLASCQRDEWGGSYNHGDLSGRDYMVRIVDQLMVDNLKQLELAIFIDGNSEGTSTRFTIEGPIWTAGSKWTVNKGENFLYGMVITKTGADSTWTMARSGKYSLGSYYYESDPNYLPRNFETSYEMQARMLADETSSKDHHNWDLTLKNCVRTEDNGYKAVLYTGGKPLTFSGGSFGGWSACHGILLMEVYKDGKLIDKARLELAGKQDSGSFIRNL